MARTTHGRARTAAGILAGSVAIAIAFATPGMASGAPADEAWRDTALSPDARAAALLAVLTQDEKLSVAVGDLSGLAQYGVAQLPSQDGPNGISLPGTTVFPSGYNLASTFGADLANQYGTAVGTELRGKGEAVWLGPGLDIARVPQAGRQTESLGEDPDLVGELARAAVVGAKSTNTIQTLKHYIGNNQEHERIGYQSDTGGRTHGVDVVMSDRARHEIYARPFLETLAEGGADSVMCSYNSLDGIQTCQNPEILGELKANWPGVVTPDFLNAVRDQVAAANAGVDLPQFDQGSGGRTRDIFTSGAVSQERLDDIVRRTLRMIFSSGLFDHPVGAAASVVSTPEHQDLSTTIAADGMVLLKNDEVLPLSSGGGNSIAVVGPSGTDAIYTIGGSAAVTTTVGTNVTPLQGIQNRANGATVTSSQGSAGDIHSTTAIPASRLTTSGGVEGWDAQYWNTVDSSGAVALQRVESDISLASAPSGVDRSFSARWTSTLTPPETGTYRFSALEAGAATVTINGTPVLSGERESAQFIAGPFLPLQGNVELTAGQPVSIQVEYSTRAAGWTTGIDLGWQTPSQSAIPAAVEAARTADVAVVMANFATSEGADRTSLSLPGDQNQLIEAVAAVNPNTVVVLNTGGSVLMPWIDDVAGVVQAWYPGQNFGTALASILFGDVNPSGHLPVTFQADETQGPGAAGGARTYPGQGGTEYYDEGIFVGYRWFDRSAQEPLFAFGHGLSYTQFAYSAPRVTPTADGVAVTVTVTNTGDRAGTAVPQAYLGAPDVAGVEFAEKSLIGFDRVGLAAGESKDVTLAVTDDDVSYWSDSASAWVIAPQGRDLFIGSSSDDLSVTVPDVFAAAAAGVSVSVDPAAPDGSGGWYRVDTRVSATSTVDGAAVEARVGAGEWQSSPNPVVVTQDGVTQVAFRAVVNGTVRGAEASATISRDSTPPVTDASVEDGIVTLTGTDGTSGVARTEVNTGAAWLDYTAPFAVRGAVRVRSVDVAGNTEAAFTVDGSGVTAASISIEPKRVTAGKSIEVKGTGVSAGTYTLVLRSEPVTLTSVNVRPEADGFATSAVVPAATEAGMHSVELVDSRGVVVARAALEVVADPTRAGVAFGGNLASTGTSAAPVLFGSLALIAIGALFLLYRRRRASSAAL